MAVASEPSELPEAAAPPPGASPRVGTAEVEHDAGPAECSGELAEEGDQAIGEAVEEANVFPSMLTSLLRHIQDQVVRSGTQALFERSERLVRLLMPCPVDTATALGPVDLRALRAHCVDGVPDELPALRAVLWKLLLGYLPVDIIQWEAALRSSREDYLRFLPVLLGDLLPEVHQLSPASPSPRGSLLSPSSISPAALLPVEVEVVSPCCSDTSSSASTTAPVDVDLGRLLRQISKDVARTRPELAFFSQRVDGADCAQFAQRRCCSLGMQAEDIAEPTYNLDVVARILLLYARLNPGVGYIQGMNDLCAPIYYAFCRDPLGSRTDAEADTFFCFSAVVSAMRDGFVEDLNEMNTGMLGRMRDIDDVLREVDSELWTHLDTQNTPPMCYSARWVTTMLAQDLQMPDILRCWDALLGDLHSERPLLHYVCAARVVNIRELLLESDEAECIMLLQREGYPQLPIDETLALACKLRTALLCGPASTSRRCRALSFWSALRPVELSSARLQPAQHPPERSAESRRLLSSASNLMPSRLTWRWGRKQLSSA